MKIIDNKIGYFFRLGCKYGEIFTGVYTPSTKKAFVNSPSSE